MDEPDVEDGHVMSEEDGADEDSDLVFMGGVCGSVGSTAGRGTAGPGAMMERESTTGTVATLASESAE